MNVNIPAIKLNHLVEFVISNYEAYGPIKKEGKTIFGKVEHASDLILFKEKTTIPFKKIIFPNGLDLNATRAEKKIALIGINNCDTWALHRFLDQFSETDLLPTRENLLIIGAECKPGENCFCDLMGTNEYAPFDFFLQDDGNNLDIFSGTEIGNKILRTIGLKNSSKKLTLRAIETKEKAIESKLLTNAIYNKSANKDLWQGISNNCFGCGSCSMVCPLCFCTRQDFGKELAGNNTRCIKWDSCFSKGFSEVQHHFDYRDNNADRLYNWYHHKFVRSINKNKYFLCTGCGRCIDACPAKLNTKNILKTLIEKNN